MVKDFVGLCALLHFVVAVDAAAVHAPVVWMAPFLTGGGYSSEAISYALALEHELHNFSIVQFAEQADAAFAGGLPHNIHNSMHRLMRRGRTDRSHPQAIAICHSTPDVWVPSAFPGWDSVAPCPPPSAAYRIGRTMYETDRVPIDWTKRCSRMDEIWVR